MSTTTGGRRARQVQRTEQTRRLMLDAARAAYRDLGYQRTSVGEIAARAGRGHGTFYLYFANKDHAFKALVAEHMARVRERIGVLWAGSVAPARAWRDLVTFLRDIETNSDLWALGEELTANDPTVAATRRDLATALAGRFASGLTAHPRADLGELPEAALGQLLAATVMRLARTGRLPAPAEQTAETLIVMWGRAVRLPARLLKGIAAADD